MRFAPVVTLVAVATAACTAGPEAPTNQPQRDATTAAHPTPAPAPEVTAEDVIADPDARVRYLAVSPSDPDVRIAQWYSCEDPSCRRQRYALAVTDDGFVTRHVVDLPAERVDYFPTTDGTDAFLVLGNVRRWMVGADGTVTEVQPATGPRGPLGEREVAVRGLRSPHRWFGLEPATGAQHALSTPAGLESLNEGRDGRLRGLTSWRHGRRYVVSQDRGATWRSEPLPITGSDLAELLPSASRTQAVKVGGDGATMFPWERVLRSDDDGRTWTSYDGPDDPRASIGHGVVLPDGRLVLEVMTWTDQHAGRPPRHPTGLFSSDDWTNFRVPRPRDRRILVLDVSVHGKGVSIWATGWQGRFDEVRRTDDGGLSWHEERAR